jgi:hypothetical protein
MRYAIVHGSASKVRPYLPAFYRALPILEGGALGRSEQGVCLVYGEDFAGWTLDKYVLPRLASGLYFGEEVVLEDVENKEPVDSQTCPTCGGTQLEGDHVEILVDEGDGIERAYQNITCLGCPTVWTDIYKWERRTAVWVETDGEEE